MFANVHLRILFGLIPKLVTKFNICNQCTLLQGSLSALIIQILNALEGNSKHYFPDSIIVSRSLRGNSFHYISRIKEHSIFCFIGLYRFCFEREIVKTNDRLKSCQWVQDIISYRSDKYYQRSGSNSKRLKQIRKVAREVVVLYSSLFCLQHY